MLNQKMLAVMEDVNNQVTEREELIEAIAVALLTKKNLFILGEPGQAKSQVINEFRNRINGAKQFERLLSKQADEEQLFGRIDLATLIPGNADMEVLANDQEYQTGLVKLQELKQAGADSGAINEAVVKLDVLKKAAYALYGNKPKLITTGKIPDSHIIFLDEIFKASDGILNSLLTALNERRFTNEGKTTNIPAISFFAASNEIPNFNDASEKILKALYDRLELKLVTEYVREKDNRLRILKNKQNGKSGHIQSTITLNELYQMQTEVAAVSVSDDINELMDDILCALRDKGVHISDRKYFGYYPLTQALAWLNGRNFVETYDLLILRHYLWTAPEERQIVHDLLVHKCINPLKEALDDIIKMGVDAYGDFEKTKPDAENPQSDLIGTKRIGKLRGEYLELYKMIVPLQEKAQSTLEIEQIESTIEKLEEYSQKAHDAVGFAYTPLNQLHMLNKLSQSA